MAILYPRTASIEAIRAEMYQRLAFVGQLDGFSRIPETLHEGLVEYALTGRPTGHFLQAVIEGDLYQACARADLHSRHALYSIVFWLVNYTPASCYGAPSAYQHWRDVRGLQGLRESEAAGG